MSSDDFEEPRSPFALILGITLTLGCLVGAGLFFTRCSAEDPIVDAPPVQEEPAAPVEPEPAQPMEKPEEVIPPQTPEQILADLSKGAESLDPADLIKQIGTALEAGDIIKAAELIGQSALTPEQLKRLEEMNASAALSLQKNQPITEIGELEANRRARWALNLDDQFASRIYFDLARRKNGKWSIEHLKLPPALMPGGIPPKAVLVDALGITDAFLQAALKQEFEDAKSFVNPASVSDATIAGLCIIFEEGKYQLRAKKPLRAMFNRDTTAGFMANVESPNGELASEFGLLVQRESETTPWRIQEINLDKLLADYAERVAGGDVHYTPLVKNPAGGDTLILYFGFDEETLTPRTERQLDIVVNLLKIDPDKKLNISGYTDALGTEDYNETLSAKRAESVKKYLIASGVPPAQVITQAKGAANPRLPNTTPEGEDNPLGRRANRRTEIYLDF
ncbi:MAG: OmpA family protein [Verrucomicrobiales bacterium]